MKSISTKTIAEISHWTPVNKVDLQRALSIASAVVKKQRADWIPLLFYRPDLRAITGSHRIIACRMILSVFEFANNAELYTDIHAPVVDVTKEVDHWQRMTGRGMHAFPFGTLRDVFRGTRIEAVAKYNKEW